MEFNFQGDDLKPRPFQFPSSIQSHFRVPKTEQMLTPNGPCEDILRKLEKDQIRREIISGDIARRRMLEEEVRRELMLESELTFRRNLGEKFLYDEQMAVRLNPILNAIPPFDNRPLEERIAFPNARLTLPQSSQPVDPEIKSAPKSNKDKLIMLGKPDPEIHKAKRKAETEPVVAVDEREHSPLGLKRKPKDDWSCALCRVSVTSEKALKEHLQGKKHKAKEESVQRMQKIGTSASPSFSPRKSEKSRKPTETIVITTTSGLDAKADVQVQPEVTGLGINPTAVGKDLVESKTEDEEIVQKTQITEDSRNQKGTETDQVTKPNAGKKRRFKVWCELCQVGSYSKIVMETHWKGRKHINRLKKSRQNDGNAAPTSAVVSKATTLTKDADAANNIQKYLMKTNDGEVVMEGFPSGKSSPAAKFSGCSVVGEQL